MKKLTDRQREVFNFLRDYYHEHGFIPSMREIADHFGFTPRSAMGHLEALEKKGFISREHDRPRMIRFVKDYFSLKVSAACPDSSFRTGDNFIVCRTTRPVAGDGVVVEKEGALRIEVFRGQKPILGKVMGLCRKV